MSEAAYNSNHRDDSHMWFLYLANNVINTRVAVPAYNENVSLAC